jgi:LssY C-terminus
MSTIRPRRCLPFAALALCVWFFPFRAGAQLVPDDAAPATQPPAAKQTEQDAAGATTATTMSRLSQELQITGEETWFDAGIDMKAGERVVISATGRMRYADQKADNGPEGIARGFKDLIRVLPYNDAGRGALIGRIGDKDVAQPFLIGTKLDTVSPIDGRLSVGINQTSSDVGDGTYIVRVEVFAAAGSAGRVVSKQVNSLPGIDNALFSKIPRRIGDKAGNPGDMVNFLILGSEDAMKNVFTTAGWVHVDADVRDTILHGLIESISKESYLTMPMSQLYLFGRPQDYGWAHAEPISVVASRNHLRVWKAPFQVNGETVWVGAATHDVGFERDQRNNGVTHKIDPDIDLERDYVEKTLSSTGLVEEVVHFLPDHPLTEAKTATGGTFHSNGKVLVLKLAVAPKDSTTPSSANSGQTPQSNSPSPL